jgi:hypothetical protein
MSKLIQIEQALRGIGGAAFQRLCDAYLHQRGYDKINAIGLVIGADKVKQGTPDTFIPLHNGNYVFAEYTAEKKAGRVVPSQATLTCIWWSGRGAAHRSQRLLRVSRSPGLRAKGRELLLPTPCAFSASPV